MYMRGHHTIAWATCCVAGSVADVLSGLETLACVLLDGSLPLEALPLIVLWEHVALHATGQLQATVLARLARARALVALGLLESAADVITGLMAGRNLPSTEQMGGRLTPATTASASNLLASAPCPSFDASRLPGHEANRSCLLHIADGALVHGLSALYGPWAMAQLAAVRAGFLSAVGATPQCYSASSATDGSLSAEERAVTEQIEPALMYRAAALLGGSVNDCRAVMGMQALSFPVFEAQISLMASVQQPSPSPAPAPGKGTKSANASSPAKLPQAQPAASVAGLSRAASAAVAVGAPRADGGSDEDHRLLISQCCRAAVTGLLQLAEVECAQGASHRGLHWALAATDMLSSHDDTASGLVCR